MKKLKHISEEQIEMYLTGKLNSSEQMQMEEFLSENPFEAEALEGLKSIGFEERERDIATLKQQLPHNQTPSFRLNWSGIAAAIVFLVSSVSLAIWLLKNPQIEENVALKENTAQQETTVPQKNDENKTENVPLEENKKAESSTQTIQPDKSPKNTKSDEKESFADLKEKEEVVTTEKMLIPEEKKIEEIKAEKPILEKKKEEIKDKGESITDYNAGNSNVKQNANKDMKVETAKQSSTAIIKADERLYKRQERKAAKKAKVTPNQEQRALNMSKETDLDNVYYDLSGQVLDSSTQKTLSGVDVTVKNQNVQGKTDSLGNYLLRSRENNNILLFRKDGYEQQEIQVRPNEKRTIYLKPKF